MPAAKKPAKKKYAICGAKTRAGTPCQKAPMAGRTRCRKHGGVTKTIGTSYAAKPGALYSKYLTPEEEALHAAMELGNVDGELKLCRIRLNRALIKEKEANDQLELDTMVKRDGGGENIVDEERHFKRRDYPDAIHRLLTRIESLERTRAELMKKGAEGDDTEPAEPMEFTFTVVDGRKDKDA